MWSRWWCAGGGICSLKQRVSYYGGKLRPLNPPLSSLREIAPLSFAFGEIIRRGMCSSPSPPPSDSGESRACGNGGGTTAEKGSAEKLDAMSFCEAKKLMKLVNVESLKTKLSTEGKEVIPFSELLQVCESMGVARTPEEASAYARVLDEAGVILLFRDKVYLHPKKVSFIYTLTRPFFLLCLKL